MTAVSVLIITCPCALGLATPTVQTVVSGAMFRPGVLLSSGDAIERLAEVDRIIFDKTGTLTLSNSTLSTRRAFRLRRSRLPDGSHSQATSGRRGGGAGASNA